MSIHKSLDRYAANEIVPVYSVPTISNLVPLTHLQVQIHVSVQGVWTVFPSVGCRCSRPCRPRDTSLCRGPTNCHADCCAGLIVEPPEDVIVSRVSRVVWPHIQCRGWCGHTHHLLSSLVLWQLFVWATRVTPLVLASHFPQLHGIKAFLASP